MKRVVTLMILGLILSKVAFAGEGKLVAWPDKDAILLRWPLLKNTPLKKLKVKIYRKEVGKNWQEIKSIKANTDLAVYKKYGREFQAIINSLLDGNYPPQDEKFQPDFYMFLLYLETISQIELAQELGIFYRDKEVAKDKRYLYRVVYVLEGKEIKKLLSQPVSLADYKPLASFKASATAGDKEIFLKWELRPEYVLYLIYRGKELLTPQGHFVSDKEAKLNYYFKDQGLVNFREYTYEIYGIDIMGRKSPPAIVKVKPEDLTPPQVPEGLKVEVKDKYVELNWKKNEEQDLAGYYIYRSQGLKQKPERLNKRPLNKNKFADKNIKEGIHYWYAVSAVDRYGNESGLTRYKLAQIIDKTPPSAPKNFNAEVKPGAVILNWKANSESDLQGYRVYRRVSEEGKWIMLNNGNIIKDNSYQDRNLPLDMDDVNLYYFVKALDRSYNESKPSKTLKLKLPDVTPPQPPRILDWEEGEDYLIINYEVFDPDTEKVEIKLKDEAGVLKKFIPTSSPFKIKDLKPNTSYTIEISAYDEADNESPKISFNFKTLRTTEKKKIKFKAKLAKKEGINILKWQIPPDCGVIIYRDGIRITALLRKENQYYDYLSQKEPPQSYKIEVYDKLGRKVGEKEIKAK